METAGSRCALSRPVCQEWIHLTMFGLEVEHFGSQVASPTASCGSCTGSVLRVLAAASMTVVAEGASIAADLLVPCLLY